MPTRKVRSSSLYGYPGSNINQVPVPIIQNRAPAATDQAEIGTLWVDSSANTAYILTSIGASGATWTTSPSGGTSATSFTVNPGNLTVTAGDIIVSAGDVTAAGIGTFGSLSTGNATVGGTLGVTGVATFGSDVNITGNFNLSGDFDVTDTASIGITSTNNAAGAITLLVNGGAAETMLLQSAQGTGADSIDIDSVAGGVTVTAGLATADAINLVATNGGIDMDSALLINITSSRNNAQAIFLEATAGGIDITATGAAAGEDIDIIASSSINLTSTENAAQAIYLRANGGVTETVQLHADQGTAVNSINLLSDVGGITLTATGLASADAINLEATAGGIDADAALQINIASSQAAVADSVRIIASAADGGMDLDAGTGGMTLDSTGAISIDGAAASNFSVSGAGIDLSLVSAAGRVVVNGEEAAADAVRILSAAGGLDANVALQMNLDSSQAAAADSVRIVASAADGGMDIDAGTGGITIDSTGAISIDGAAASNMSVSGAGIDLTLASAAGRVVVNGEEAAADAVRILSAVGGLDANVALQMNLDSSQAAADAIRLFASNAAGGIDVDYGTGGMSVVGANGAFNLETGTGAINIGADAAAHAITIGNVTGATSVAINSGTGSIALASTGTGDITINSDDTLLLDADGVLELNSSAGAINIGNDADANAINIGSAGVRPIQLGNASAGTTVTILGPANVGVTLQNSIRIMTGAGSPDTVVTAPAGSLWLRTDPAGATSRIYVNTDSATAWTNVTCAA